jgi:hypothetical protein
VNLIALAIIDRIKQLEDGEEEIIMLDGQAYVISRATVSDVKRIMQGIKCMD